MALLDKYKTFNKALLEFIKDLATSFPQVEGFRNAYASTNLMSMMNPEMVSVFFHKYCSRYVDNILRRDEGFFLEKDYGDEMASVGEGIEIISMVKGIWKSLDEAGKEVVWKHLEVLVALDAIIEKQKQT
jgi:hypothetical protein